MMGYGNYWNTWNGAGMMPFFGAMGGFLGFFLIPFLLWSLFWKGWALWRAVKEDSKVWFVVLLVVNTLGILDILYIFLFSKRSSRRSR